MSGPTPALAVPVQPAEREAFLAQLFTRLYPTVRALCRHLAPDPAAAEDLVQDTLVLVHRGLPAFRGECALTTWVYRIALRCAARSARPAQALPLEAAAEVPAPGASTEDAVEGRRQLRRVAAALARLPLEQRAVLGLSAIEGLSHRAIAEVLGVPEGTVGSRLFTARKRLAEALQPVGEVAP